MTSKEICLQLRLVFIYFVYQPIRKNRCFVSKFWVRCCMAVKGSVSHDFDYWLTVCHVSIMNITELCCLIYKYHKIIFLCYVVAIKTNWYLSFMHNIVFFLLFNIMSYTIYKLTLAVIYWATNVLISHLWVLTNKFSAYFY